MCYHAFKVLENNQVLLKSKNMTPVYIKISLTFYKYLLLVIKFYVSNNPHKTLNWPRIQKHYYPSTFVELRILYAYWNNLEYNCIQPEWHDRFSLLSSCGRAREQSPVWSSTTLDRLQCTRDHHLVTAYQLSKRT